MSATPTAGAKKVLKAIRDGVSHRASQATYEQIVSLGLATPPTDDKGWTLTEAGNALTR